MSLWYWNNEWSKANLFRSEMGSDAILACPGPSLKKHKQLQGPGRVVFGINTSYPTIRPDIWIGMDEAWCYNPNLIDEGFTKIYRGSYSEMVYEGIKVKTKPLTYFADVNFPPENKTMLDLLVPDAHFAWHKHTLGVALHIIMWMGAKKIYLVGCDLGGTNDYCHDLILTEEQRKRNRLLYSEQIEFLKKLHSEALKHGIELISSTENSPINNFMRYVDIETVGQKKEATIRYVTDRPCTPVTVLKTGGIYTKEHVQRLAKQVPNLVCFSDLQIPGVKTIPLKHNWPGWWSKMEVFRPDAITGDILHIDLDTTVRNIEPFLKVGKTTMLQDFYFPEAKASGLMYIHEADKEKVYKAFLSDSEAIMKQKRSVPYHGDQGVLNDLLDAQAWQTLMPGKVVSYKVHGDDGTADVVCFHGKPKPWDVE